ncbi:MAG: hypothetical protein HXS44_15280 [Theionarchaea archaeon]|nr:hypothetical protein [Theionarchaea archaeon]
METKMKNGKVVVSIFGTIILLLGMTAQMSFAGVENHGITVGPGQQGVEFTGINDSGKDISGFTIEIAKSARINITGVLVESDQYGGCGDWDLDDDEDGRSQEEMEQDNWDSTPKSGKAMWTWYTRVDCMGKDGRDGVPIRKGEQYTIRIWFTEKTKNNAYIYIYASDEDNFQIAGVDTIGREEDEPEKAAKMLSEMIIIPKTSEVFFVGPVGPGTVLRENRPIGYQQQEEFKNPPIEYQTPVKLEIPDENGTYYAFYINDMPGFMFVHGVRYAWVNVETTEYKVVDARWSPLILEPGVTPAPFGSIRSYQISGARFCYGEGGGTGSVNDTDHKPDAKPHLTSMMYNCTALVIDGGDMDSIIHDAADNFAKHADLMKEYLEDNGFDVVRISQYWGNDLPKIRYDPNKEDAMNEQLKEIIEGFTSNPNPPKEFFLYINAHGNEEGFELYDPTGSGRKPRFIFYSDLFESLSKFNKIVNIVIFIDSCYSGGAVDRLKENERIGQRTGLTIITATDNETPASSGEVVHSATQDFIQGRYSDFDEDGRVGDLGDCWISMREQAVLDIPLLFYTIILYTYNPWFYQVGQPSTLD